MIHYKAVKHIVQLNQSSVHPIKISRVCANFSMTLRRDLKQFELPEAIKLEMEK